MQNTLDILPIRYKYKMIHNPIQRKREDKYPSPAASEQQ